MSAGTLAPPRLEVMPASPAPPPAPEITVAGPSVPAAESAERGQESLMSPSEILALYDQNLRDGTLPSIYQVHAVREFMDDFGGLSSEILGPDSDHRLRTVANPNVWYENPRDVFSLRRLFENAAELLLRRDKDPGAAARPPQLPAGFDERAYLSLAEIMFQQRFAKPELGNAETLKMTPDNLFNAAALLKDAVDNPDQIDHSVREHVGVGVAPVVHTRRAEVAPTGNELIWLIDQGAAPDSKEIAQLLYPSVFSRWTSGGWGDLYRPRISKAREDRIKGLTHQLKTFNRHIHEAQKRKTIPSAAALTGELFGRAHALTELEAHMVENLRDKLTYATSASLFAKYRKKASKGKPMPSISELTDELFGRDYELADTDTQAALRLHQNLMGMVAVPDKWASLRHRREKLARWGRRRRGDSNEYYGDSGLPQSPGGVSSAPDGAPEQRRRWGRVAHWDEDSGLPERESYDSYGQEDWAMAAEEDLGDEVPHRRFLSRLVGTVAVWLATGSGYRREVNPREIKVPPLPPERALMIAATI